MRLTSPTAETFIVSTINPKPMAQDPFVSVIIPVHNSRRHLGRCLNALFSSSYSRLEIIVVDDASTDDCAQMGHQKGVTVLKQENRCGPASARNLGARHAQGTILLFVDSDVVVKADTIERTVQTLASNPETAAVFGSYDDQPAERDFLSQYKNFFHHFVHQNSRTEAATFWAGCGAIRRDVFQEIGGFDQEKYPQPSIEDIELGYRVKRKGYQIVLDKELQVQHLKRWTLTSLLRSDIFCRAVPWSKLVLETREMLRDLNLKQSHRVSSGLVGLWILATLLSVLEPRLACFVVALPLGVLILNWRLYQFFFQKRGFRFAVTAFVAHFVYYLYSGITFAACWSMNLVAKSLRRPNSAA